MKGGPHCASHTRTRATPAREHHEADGHTLPARRPPGGGDALQRAVQALNRRREAVTGSGRRASTGQEGATRVTRRRAAGPWLP
ncbi:conserved hypothetical protein [Burkholderia ambifaria]